MRARGRVAEPWEITRKITEFLGLSGVNSIWNVTHEQVRRWGRDPSVGTSNRGPVENLRRTVQALVDLDQDSEGRELGVEIVRYISGPLDVAIKPLDLPEPDQPTLEAELLEDYPALVAYHQGMVSGAPTTEVSALLDRAKRELSESLARYTRGDEHADT